MTDVAASYVPINQISIQFNQPVASGSTTAISAVCNALLNASLPVGSIVQSMLTETQFQTELGSTTTWILADGRNVSGSTYQFLTGSTSIPDLRGVYLRGKNYDRSDGKQNPDGNLALGTITADKLSNHTHVIGAQENDGLNTGSARNQSKFVSDPNVTCFTFFSGSAETSPKNVTLNTFIRIN